VIDSDGKPQLPPQATQHIKTRDGGSRALRRALRRDTSQAAGEFFFFFSFIYAYFFCILATTILDDNLNNNRDNGHNTSTPQVTQHIKTCDGGSRALRRDTSQAAGEFFSPLLLILFILILILG